MIKDFSVINQYFDKVYVLTLKKATERQSLFIKNFPGLNFNFLYGIDKDTFTIEEAIKSEWYDDLKAKKNHRYGKSMTTGQIGCAIGHRLIYEDIVKNNYQKALIFEDDVCSIQNNPQLLLDVLTEQPADGDILMFDYNKNETSNIVKQFIYHIQHSCGALKWNHQMISNLYPKRFSKYWMKAGYHEFADAYAVTQYGAKKILDMQKPINYIADQVIPHLITKDILKGYICVPKLFQQLSTGKNKSIHSYIDD